MPYNYPVFLNLESAICLVVGAGPVGLRKAAGLLEAGATVRLVALEVADSAQEVLNDSKITLLHEAYRSEHLNEVALAFAATDDPSVNAQIVVDARRRNIPVNCADSQDHKGGAGEFIVPALLRRGDLCIAISTGGASPKLAQKIRSDLEEVYGVEYSAYVELLAEMRSYIKERTDDSTLRALAFKSLVEAEAALRQMLGNLERENELVAARKRAGDEARRIVDTVIQTPPE